MSAQDLAWRGHLTRNAIEDYEFLIAAGVSHDDATRRTGIDWDRHLAAVAKRVSRHG